MKCIKAVTLGFILLSFSQLSMAGTVVSCASRDDGKTAKYDYGNALESYGSACNATDTWQNLGSKDDWSADKSKYQYKKNQDNHNAKLNKNNKYISEDKTDNGVTWSVQQADGSWTAFGTTATLIQGQDVQFQFQVTRSTTGNHQYDLLKAWVDWNGTDGKNGSGGFLNNVDFNDQQMFTGTDAVKNNEVIINEKWDKDVNADLTTKTVAIDGEDVRWVDINGNHTKQRISDNSYWNNDLDAWNSLDTERFFTTTITVPMDSVVGDTWMRARVVCENSLSSHSDNYNLLPTGFQDQGETEDYKLTIAKKVDVPEPSTLVVFLSGMMLLMVKRRKANSGFNA